MVLLAITLLALGQTKTEPQLDPVGQWRIVGNGSPGYLVISAEKDGSIKGSIFDETCEGTFDPATRRITLRRLYPVNGGGNRAVQEFTGELRQDDRPGATRVMSGTFRSVFGPEWGKDGVDYSWEATALTGTIHAEQLKELAGHWEVVDSQLATGASHNLPESSPLVSRGAFLEIRNNQIFHADKLVATLANDLRMPSTMPPMRINRKPMMIVFPDGTGYLAAYDSRPGKSLQIVFPHTTGNVGIAQFIYWRKPAVRDDSAAVKFIGYDDEVRSLSFSSDGKQLAATCGKAVCIWEPATGQEIQRHSFDEREAVGLNPNLTRMAIGRPYYFVPWAGPMNGKLTLKSIADGQDIWSTDAHAGFEQKMPFVPAISAIVFSPDGKRLVTAGGAVKTSGEWPKGIVRIWDADTGKQIRLLDELSSRADTVAFSSDGKQLVAGTIGVSGEAPKSAEVHVWDSVTGQRLHTLTMRDHVPQGGDPGTVMRLAFHPNGTRLAVAVSDGSVRFWELPSGKELLRLPAGQGQSDGQEVDRFTGLITGRTSAVRAMAFSPDGNRLATAGYDRVVRVWNTSTEEQIATYQYDSPRINAVAFSRDGQRLAASGSNSEKSAEVVIWTLSDKTNKLAEPVPPGAKSKTP